MVVMIVSGYKTYMISQIVSLVSTRPRVSKLEFFVALALVALAQSGKGAYSTFRSYIPSKCANMPYV